MSAEEYTKIQNAIVIVPVAFPRPLYGDFLYPYCHD